ncbi:MAG: hypothetical protein D6760_11665 [Deltaproteobacteria bacterium]|nr:MAG: hypothetical protein D6760_11665 [Deltaproteobacteria bacterium]
MTGLVLGLALLVALAAAGWRALRRVRLARRLAALPGGSLETAMVAASFRDIEDEVGRRRCPCGGRLSLRGESSREHAGRRYRVAAVECELCERRSRVYFDVTGLFH